MLNLHTLIQNTIIANWIKNQKLLWIYYIEQTISKIESGLV